MNIYLKFSPKEQIKFHSPDYGTKVFTGIIDRIEIEVRKDSTNIYYRIIADQEYKSSNIHYIEEIDVVEIIS